MEKPENIGFKHRLLEIVLILAAILLISVLHYSTAISHYGFHDFYRRLYYLPIIIAAIRFGVWGGLAASVLSSLMYIPHAFLLYPNIDPQNELDKILEIVLYNVIALVAGILFDRLQKENKQCLIENYRYKKAADELKNTLDRFDKVQFELRVAERLAAIGQLTAGLAHEIRNPLASIQGTAEILQDEFPRDHPKYEMASILIAETKRLNDTLNRFLQFARPHTINATRIDLNEELRALEELLRRSELFRDHKIIRNVAPEITTLYADGAKLRQVMLNLGLNALEAMPGSGDLKISVSRETIKDVSHIAFSISDTGRGVDNKVMERMFNPFFSTKENGTGLGLSIVQRIIEDHGGSIDVSSTPGVGTSVTVFIPERQQDDQQGTHR